MNDCYDPECSGTAEPEQDGDLTYLVCDCCGYEFGFQMHSTTVAATTCAVGIPEAIRRAASATPPGPAGPPSGRPPLPLLQIGRRP